MSHVLKHELLARPITREEALTLRGALSAALRTNHAGPPRTCECGTCPKCKRRLKRKGEIMENQNES